MDKLTRFRCIFPQQFKTSQQKIYYNYYCDSGVGETAIEERYANKNLANIIKQPLVVIS